MTVRSQREDWNIEETGKRQETGFNANVGTALLPTSPTPKLVSPHPLSLRRKTTVETRITNQALGATQWILMYDGNVVKCRFVLMVCTSISTEYL